MYNVVMQVVLVIFYQDFFDFLEVLKECFLGIDSGIVIVATCPEEAS